MFYDKFKALCEQKKVSCSKAAQEIGLGNSTVTKWKKTGATPDGATLVKIADYFNTSVDILLDHQIRGLHPINLLCCMYCIDSALLQYICNISREEAEWWSIGIHNLSSDLVTDQPIVVPQGNTLHKLSELFEISEESLSKGIIPLYANNSVRRKVESLKAEFSNSRFEYAANKGTAENAAEAERLSRKMM